MSSSHILEPGYVIADRYRVQRQLGEGGMGQVYLVQHLKTDERFALKILHPSMAETPTARERFRREARTPARIDSDHVARVVDTDIAVDLSNAPFLVMEYLRGKNLQELSEDLGPLDPDEVCVYLRQVASALDKAHAIGIVHRDLKPENLFLTTRDDGSPCVKVLDFGIAKLSGATGDLVQIKATSTGDVFGTPLYMSPEQCKSESHKESHQTDLWALGLIAHRLLAGADFWTANTLTHLVAQIAYEPMPKPSQRGAFFGAAYDAWFGRCCEREVTERYDSAGEAVAALHVALGLRTDGGVGSDRLMAAADKARAAAVSLPGTTNPDALKQTSDALTLDSLARPQRRGWLLAGAGVTIAVLLFGGGMLLLGGGDESDGAAATGASAAPEPSAAAAASTATAESTGEPTTTENAAEPSADPAASGSAPEVLAPPVSASALATVAPPVTRLPVVPPAPGTSTGKGAPTGTAGPPPTATTPPATSSNPLDRRH